VTNDEYYYFATPMIIPSSVPSTGITYRYNMAGNCSGGFDVTYRSCRLNPACWSIYMANSPPTIVNATATASPVVSTDIIIAISAGGGIMLGFGLCLYCVKRGPKKDEDKYTTDESESTLTRPDTAASDE
jgi:hypothetical protein